MKGRILDSSGKTVEEATEKGLKVLGAAREDVQVKVLDKGIPGVSHARVRIAEKGVEMPAEVVDEGPPRH